ncbi:MAG: hypothetical protein JWO94_1353 [Verrucomicrobiaceae bacterium]|nr:hypothetical protein [Verrucomicrobiaceae bacterium]
MNARSPLYLLPRQLPFLGLDSGQRSLVEYVSASPAVPDLVRKRAQALLLLDEGEPVEDIALLVSLPLRTLRSLIRRHRENGVRAALLQHARAQPRQRLLAMAAA